MIITTADAPAAIGPYVQGVNLGAMTITSGQLPINPLDGTMPEDIAEQARQSLENVKAIVEAAGLTVGQIVKTTVFVKDRRILPPSMPPTRPSLSNTGAFPARSCVEVARLPKDAGVEIEAIAFAR
ncbi:Rid family detoxifying hydrolase [Klebsiella pneumoniae]